MINEFRGQYNFLSNFHILENPIKVGSIEFPTNEHFYQAHKTLELINRLWIAGLDNPAEAKKAGSGKGLNGRKIQLRDDWESEEVRDSVMYLGLTMKFVSNYNLAAGLLNTGSKKLIEGNRWHDNYWGDCYCARCSHIKGKNTLGLMLMDLRNRLNTVRI